MVRTWPEDELRALPLEAFDERYRRYRPVACRPRRAQTKGKIERPFQYVESSLLGGREFRSLEHLNEVTAWWLENVGLLQSQRNGWQQAEKVLALLATYRPSDFQAALERAVRYGAFSLGAVQRILAVQAQPKSCLEPLAEQATEQLPDALRTPATPPRPPADHQPLLFAEKASPI